jgi:hypothetical protein
MYVWFGMQLSRVRASGRSVGAFARQATAVATGCLDALADSAGAVGHAEVAAALREYHEDQVPIARSMPAEVDSLSARTVAASVDIESGDERALAAMLLPWQTSEELADTLLNTRLGAGDSR